MNRLRRLLTATNWKYAAGEIALIVAGVLIALAVDSWADDRQERKRERAYLVQLLADVRENERRIRQAVREDSTQFYVGLSRVLRAARRPGPLQVDSVGVFTGFSMFRPLTGTYTALVQSGSVNLLRNDRLRFEVIRYAGEMESVAASFRTTEEVTVRTVAAWNHAEWNSRRIPPGAGARWRDELDWESLLHDPEVLSALDMQRDAVRMHMYLLRSLQEPTATLRHLLEKELGVRRGAAPSP